MSKIYDTEHRFSESLNPGKFKSSLPPLQLQPRHSNIQGDKIEFEDSMMALNKSQDKSKNSTNNNEVYEDKNVPIYKIVKITENLDVTLPINIHNIQGKTHIYAKGILCGSINSQYEINDDISFHGHFSGTFQKIEEEGVYYFEGKISKLVMVKDNIHYLETISVQANDPAFNAQLQNQQKNFKGFFKGQFYSRAFNEQQDDLRLQNKDKIPVGISIIQKQRDPQYYVPALVTMDLRRITEINLQKSSANISATVKIQIQLNKQILAELYDFKQKKFKTKKKLNIDFHRGKPMILPFYDEDDFQSDQTDDEIEYEWDDVWQGIDLQVDWNIQQLKVKYTIDTIFTAQIDNSYGVFYSPFNLVFLKLVMDIHAVKLNKKKKICINCCDLTDYNFDRSLSPYTQLTSLTRNQKGNNNAEIFKKHNDRQTKVNITYFMDQGQYRLANNRIASFPYHKRVFLNKAQLSSDNSWLLGLTRRSDLIEKPQVRSVKEGYNLYVSTKQREIFSIEQWQFVHIQIPIFKYPVIDMIRIFVPILILSTISLLIFVQENAKDGNGFTTLAKRIASGCSLMIAYVALVPLIRSNLPPTPSVTLVEILIYISTIPNFLAIISNIFTNFIDYNDFFTNYTPFSDGLFLASFAISVVSFIILTIVMVLFSRKTYQADFTIPKLPPATVQNVRAPIFSPYISKVIENRKEYKISQLRKE